MTPTYLETALDREECARRLRACADGRIPSRHGSAPQVSEETQGGTTTIVYAWTGGARFSTKLRKRGAGTLLTLNFTVGAGRWLIPLGVVAMNALLFLVIALGVEQPVLEGTSNLALFVPIGVAVTVFELLLIWLVVGLSWRALCRAIARTVEGVAVPAARRYQMDLVHPE